MHPIDPQRAPGWADALLNRFGSLGRVLTRAPSAPRKMPELPRSALAQLAACRAAMLHSLRERTVERPALGGSRALMAYLRTDLADEPVEHLRALYLDARLRLLGEEELARGSSSGVSFDMRAPIRTALDLDASGLILVHNHPSGDPQPSEQDLHLTRRLAACLRELGLRLHDHVIIARGGAVSLQLEGLYRP